MKREHNRCAVIIHDEPIFTSTMAKALEALDFLVDVMVDPHAALARVEREPPDLVCVA
jgi:ActR/RegA family two-component response regulator